MASSSSSLIRIGILLACAVLVVSLVALQWGRIRQMMEETFLLTYVQPAQKKKNERMYALLDRIPTQIVSSLHVPDCFRNRVAITPDRTSHPYPSGSSPPSRTEKRDWCKKLLEEATGAEDMSDWMAFDLLTSKGGYFPQIHSDIEWNCVLNDGFQVWHLVENRNEDKRGNMFLLHNERIHQKYSDVALNIVFDDKSDMVCVTMNSMDNYEGRTGKIDGTLNESRVLERMSPDEFVRTTQKFYLDMEPGQTLLMAKNVLHMSEYRDDSSKRRRAVNFRVAICDPDLRFHPDPVRGYVNSLQMEKKEARLKETHRVPNPGTFERIY